MAKFRRQERTRPPGRTTLSVSDRLDWAREQWRKDPAISVNGSTGMYRRMFEVFGVAAKQEQLIEVKEEIMREIASKPTNGAGKPLNPVLTPAKLAEMQTPKPSAPIPAADAVTVKEKPVAPVYQRLGTGRTIADARERRRYARAVARKDMTVEALRDAVRREFGIGMGNTDTHAILREIGASYDRKTASDPAPRQRPQASPPLAPKPTPGLVQLEVKRGPDGRPRASWKVEAVQSGSFDL